MQHDALGIYLNDHFAGATLGADLARHVARRHRRSARNPLLELLANEIAQDRQVLLMIMDKLGVPARRYKVCAGWVAERVRRLKPNGVLQRHAGFDTVMEFETLRLGIEGKSLLWLTLIALAPQRPGLDTARLQDLLDRARQQRDAVEELRLTAAAAAFSQPNAPTSLER
ncbi:hypothetical protein [Streptomyces collinus]